MRRVRWGTFWSAVALLIPHISMAQEPAQAPAAAGSPVQPARNGKQKYSHANDFLIRGSVFTEKALSFPGVQLRIRRAGEKKFHWQDYTNSRGEFAIRVPQGFEYEMVVHAKGFADQSQTIDAKNGSGNNSLVFRMQPAAKGKK